MEIEIEILAFGTHKLESFFNSERNAQVMFKPHVQTSTFKLKNNVLQATAESLPIAYIIK